VAPTNTTPTSNVPAGPPDPRFSYMDISVAGIGNLAPHVSVNGQVSVPKFRPCMRIRKCCVHILVERDSTTWDTGHKKEDNIEINLS
jgi:hypothetical protein